MAREDVKIVITAQDKTKSGFASTSRGLKGVGGSVKQLGGLLLGPVGLVASFAALSAGFIKGIQATADFEQQLSNVSTLISGDTTQVVNELRSGIQELLKEVPKSAEELGASAYAIVSAGITDTSKALNVLRASSRLAVAGLGTTEEATTLMVLAMNNFRESGIDAEKAANLMFKTVRGGITTVSELSRSFGLVAPLAVDAGISLEELQAATAALTQVNKSASISQNAIKASLISLGKPTKDAQDLFKKLGVTTFKELIKNSGGMVNAFQAMQDASEGDSQSFARAV